MPLNLSQVQVISTQAFEFARDQSEIKLGEATIDVASAAAPVLPALQYESTTFVVALGINMTIPALSGARKGMRVSFVFAPTGVFTVTWNAQFKAAANGAAANAQFGSTTFMHNGSFFVQDAGALTFK
jgi:hypothetical protein